MKKLLQHSAVVALGLGIAVSGLTAAQAATVVQIRQADLVAPNDQVGGATYSFLQEGLHITTPTVDSYTRGHFKVGLPLAGVTAVSYEWIGTTNRAGAYYDIDADGDGTIDGQLIGEQAYGGLDVWLNRDAEDFPTASLPDGTFASVAPCVGTTAAVGVTDPCGSSGATEHGTLANWAKQLQAKTGKAPVLFSGGFSASGSVMDGVLRSITYGANQYVFTSTPVPPVAKAAPVAVATVDKTTKKPGRTSTVSGVFTPAPAAGTVATLQRKKNGTWRNKTTQVLPAGGAFSLKAKLPGKPGLVKFRVSVPVTATSLAATSPVVRVKVKAKVTAKK